MIRAPMARVKEPQGRVPMAYLIAYVACVLVMGGLDFLWLTNTSSALYQKDLGSLLADNPNMTVAVIFYLLYIVGVQVFACVPRWSQATGKPQPCSGRCLDFLPTPPMTSPTWPP
jgi:uncharacterized membrane protein